MNLFKKFSMLCSMSLMTMSFSQCGSVQKIQKDAPIELEEVYYTKWSNPARGMGSGINLYIFPKSNTENVILDSVYFRKKQTKLEYTKNAIYVGRFKMKTNESMAIVMSSDPKEEYGNPVPEIPKLIPFALKDNECIVSYKEAGKLKYFKISNILNKQNKPSSGTSIRQ